MPVAVSIKVNGTEQEIAQLKKLGIQLHDFSRAMRLIGDEVVRYYSGQGFASQGGVFSNIWPELNPIYAKTKAKNYPGRGVLVATGNMQNSFTYEADSSSVVIGNTAPYFKYHQSTEPRTKMPYRPMMLINDDVKSIIQQVIQSDVQQKIRSI